MKATKGTATKNMILERALSLASAIGLDGLTIGKLAGELDLSKSGLFAHFRSKEALQIQVLDEAAAKFTHNVIEPALKAPRGLSRVRALFDLWIDWPGRSKLDGGCPLVAAAFELDDREGAVREHLVALQKQWFDTRARIARTAVDEGQFRKDADCEQFSHELHGIMLNHHYATRLLKDGRAVERTRAAFEALLERYR